MKTIIMSIAEFYNFSALAKAYEFIFEHTIKKGRAVVRAKEQDLITLGFTEFK